MADNDNTIELAANRCELPYMFLEVLLVENVPRFHDDRLLRKQHYP